jgi:hypothetical protein
MRCTVLPNRGQSRNAPELLISCFRDTTGRIKPKGNKDIPNTRIKINLQHKVLLKFTGKDAENSPEKSECLLLRQALSQLNILSTYLYVSIAWRICPCKNC